LKTFTQEEQFFTKSHVTGNMFAVWPWIQFLLDKYKGPSQLYIYVPTIKGVKMSFFSAFFRFEQKNH